MQTINQFMQLKRVKKKTTVLNWIEKGYIPGVIRDESAEGGYLLPDSARCPYTERGDCTGNAVYRSIIKGSLKGKHVVAQLYPISLGEFESYINYLIGLGYIEPLVLDGVTYYSATIEGETFISWSNSKIAQLVEGMNISLSLQILV